MRSKNILIGLGLALALGSGVACGGSSEFVVRGENEAGGADGQVTIDRQGSGSFLVKITVTDLLPPARIKAGLTTYVIWFQPGYGTPQRIGVLEYDADSRTGRLEATTAHTSFKVIISGEATAQAAQPGKDVVFSSSVQAPQ